MKQKASLDLLREVIQERIEEKRREESMTTKKRTSTKIRETENGQEKWCPKCKDWHPATLEYFYNDSRSKTGLSSWCKKSQQPVISVKKATPAKPEKKTARKDMVLTLDFSELELLYEDILVDAADKLRTPEMQVMWLASETLYKERNRADEH